VATGSLIDKQWQDIQTKVHDALKENFPVEGRKQKLVLHNILFDESAADHNDIQSQEQAKLKQDRAALNYAEAKLLSPQNMNKMAATLKMVDPSPQQVQFLEGTAKREAQNRMPLGIEEAIQ